MEPFHQERILTVTLQIVAWLFPFIFHLSHFMKEFKYIIVRWINIIEFKDSKYNLTLWTADYSLTCNWLWAMPEDVIDIVACHSRRSTSVIDSINNNYVPFRWVNTRVLVLCMQASCHGFLAIVNISPVLFLAWHVNLANMRKVYCTFCVYCITVFTCILYSCHCIGMKPYAR